jgi:predicted transcriptional regulator of viral defense system
VPRSRFDELIALAQDNDGLFTAEQARHAGFTDSVLSRLLHRGRLERTARGVYRIPYFPADRWAHYREAVLWAQAHRGPEQVALSHLTALVIYGLSDANPSSIHLTVPRSARLRRKTPNGIVVHHADLPIQDILQHEGLPVTAIRRTVTDLLLAQTRVDLIRQAVTEARREGFLSDTEARQLRRQIDAHQRTRRTQEAKTA